MARENDDVEPVEGISAQRDESVLSDDGRSLADLAAEMEVETHTAEPEVTSENTAPQVDAAFEGMDPAVLASAKDIQDFQLLEYLEMMMTLQEAQRQGRLNEYFKKLYETLAQGKPENAGTALASFMEPRHFREVEDQYPDIAQAVTNRVVTRARDPEATAQLAEKAGFSMDEFNSMPNEFRTVLAATAEFEKDFPPVEGNALADRLKDSKPSLMEGLKSPAAVKALQFASWGFSIATGGVAMKLGVMAVTEGIKRISANPSVQHFAKSALETGIQTLQGMGVPMDKVVGGLNQVKEKTRSVWNNPKAKFAAAALGAVAVGLILNEFDFSKVAEAAKPLASNFGDLGDAVAKTAGSYVDLAGATASEIGHASTAAAMNLADNVSDAASYVGEKASEAGSYVAETTSAAYDSAKTTAGGLMADAGKALADAGHGLAGDGLITESVASNVDMPGIDADADAATTANRVGDVATDPAQSTGDASSAAPQVTQAAPSAPAVSADVPSAPVTVEIEKGDTLSHIAVEQLKANGIEVNQQNIKATWEAIYEGNKDVLTQGPHKIFPGMQINITPEMLHGVHHDPVAAVVTPVTPEAPAVVAAPEPAFTSAEEEARKIISDAVAAQSTQAQPAALPAAQVTGSGLENKGGSDFIRTMAEKVGKRAVDSGPTI
jgi:LysM repeat protein